MEYLNLILELTEEADEDLLQIILEDSEDEEELVMLLELSSSGSRGSRNCIVNYIENIVPMYSELEFRTHFRIKRSLFESLSARFEKSTIFLKLRPDKRISASKHTLVFLWFAGHEACSYRDVGDRFNLAISSVCRIISRYITFLSSLSPATIKWPNEEEMERTSPFFKNKAGFAKAIGCIDGTHVVIDPPGVSKDDYIDRKGNVSICEQAVCNEQKKFISISVGFPGSSHDSWVYQNTSVPDRLNALPEGYYLLGDSAYPCWNRLITPYRDNGHLTSAQKNFNIKLSSCRVAIEHSFGILKQRFRQLCYCKLRGVKKICHFIRACAVLHNIAGEDDIEFVVEEEQNQNIEENIPLREVTTGNAVRDVICQQLNQLTNQ